MESIDLLLVLSLDNFAMHNHSSCFKKKRRKKKRSSALIIWSIISIRTAGALATCSVRSLQPPAASPLCFPLERNVLTKADLEDRGSEGSEGRVEAQTATAFIFISSTQSAPSSSLRRRARSARFLSPSAMANGQMPWNRRSFLQHPVVAAWTC